MKRSRKGTTHSEDASEDSRDSEDGAQQDASASTTEGGGDGSNNVIGMHEGSGADTTDANGDGTSTATYIPSKEDSATVESLLDLHYKTRSGKKRAMRDRIATAKVARAQSPTEAGSPAKAARRRRVRDR